MCQCSALTLPKTHRRQEDSRVMVYSALRIPPED